MWGRELNSWTSGLWIWRSNTIWATPPGFQGAKVVIYFYLQTFILKFSTIFKKKLFCGCFFRNAHEADGERMAWKDGKLRVFFINTGVFFGLFDFWLSVLGKWVYQFGCCENETRVLCNETRKIFNEIPFLISKNFWISFGENGLWNPTCLSKIFDRLLQNLNFRIRKNQTGISDSNATF